MKNITLRNVCISIFVILWLGVFHYESIRYFYLDPLFDKPLPKVKFLFPPAGWIMFYNVDDQFGHIEVYGQNTNQQPVRLDPHDILRTRTIMFDNIHRGVLGTVADKRYGKPFCQLLERRFPGFEKFLIAVHYYPNFIKQPEKVLTEIKYQCLASQEEENNP